MTRTSLALLVLLVALPVLPAAAEEAEPGFAVDIVERDLRKRLAWLADDARQGRDTISEHAVTASQWIADQWQAMGLLPKGTEGWFQPFIVPQAVLKPGNELEVRVGSDSASYEVEKDWNPFSISRSATVEGEVVFAGYGITATEERFGGYDDYAGIDVKGKIVLIFRKNPGWRETRHASFTRKVSNAHQKGAAAVLLCNNPATVRQSGDKDVIGHWSASLGAPAGSGPIPYAFISQEIAEKLLASTGKSLAQLEAALRKDGPQSQLLENASVKLRTAMATTKDANARNVLGFLPGRDPAVSNEVVVLGAHYDHVGLGYFGSTGGPSAAGKIHNGADDNGSGTVTLLELAEWFARGENRPRRSLLFIAFTGEERGLLGSRHYVNNPTIPIADTVAMLNMDMVGRSKDGRMQMGGVGTAKGLKDLVARANEAHGLKITWDPQGTAPTDSTSFFRKGLPVLFFFTGLHADYHKPTDDIERINYADMHRICQLVRDVCTEIAEREERLVFTRPPPRRRAPTIGIRPSPEPDARGLVVAMVVPNGPAAKAGMEPADIITRIAGRVIRDIQTLRQVMVTLEAGKTVPFVVLRDGKEVTLKVTLEQRGSRRRKGK
ncbi:MAG: M28 family peptidase [Planctomycetota bacterium]|nr:M28 family peptidase [Planctomycetota bacterium]